jgi:hypothetical protein
LPHALPSSPARADQARSEQEEQLAVVYAGLEVTMTQSLGIGKSDEQILQARNRVEEQKAKLKHMIVQGAPTQAAEDLLCKLHEALQRITRDATSSSSQG